MNQASKTPSLAKGPAVQLSDEDEIQTPIPFFRRSARRVIQSLSSSDDEDDGRERADGQPLSQQANGHQKKREQRYAVVQDSDSENTADSTVDKTNDQQPQQHSSRRAHIVSSTSDDNVDNDDELSALTSAPTTTTTRTTTSSSASAIAGRHESLQQEKERKALAILRERSFNAQLDDEILLTTLRTVNFDPIRAERIIKQQQAAKVGKLVSPVKSSMTTTMNPKKPVYTVSRHEVNYAEDNVVPLVVRPFTGASKYFDKIAKEQASTKNKKTALLSDDEESDDDVRAIHPGDRRLLPAPVNSFFSKPSSLQVKMEKKTDVDVNAGSSFQPKKRPTAKARVPRGKRRFSVIHSDDDEEEEEEAAGSFSDDSDEDEDEIKLSDDNDHGSEKRRKRKSGSRPKTRMKRVKRLPSSQDELTLLADNDDEEGDEFEGRENLMSSSSEDEEDGDYVKASLKGKKKDKSGVGTQKPDRNEILRTRVVSFMNEGTHFELQSIAGVSSKKADQLIALRPFSNYLDLRVKLECTKGLSLDIVNDSLEAIRSRDVIMKLMSECENLSSGITEKVANLKEARQPEILNKDCQLKQYQLIGLNWLVLMHEKKINAILADEMGLGKTIQVIALLAYLKEKLNNKGPHLIVVPASTLDNWDRELALWCRHLDVIVYHGSQKERQVQRLDIMDGRVKFEVLLTTYNMLYAEEDKKLFKKFLFQYVVFDEAHNLKNMKTNRYAQLMQVKSHRRLLLTGTPLQNNLLELMSLLIFTMPDFFSGKTEQVKTMFTFNNFTCRGDVTSAGQKSSSADSVSYERERITHAKKIMKPFILRRLKADVLQQLPPKVIKVQKVSMTTEQKKLYQELVSSYQKDIEHDISIMESVCGDDDGSGENNNDNRSASGQNEEVRDLKMSDGSKRSAKVRGEELKARAGASMIMNLRKVANHPLLVRNIFTDDKLKKMSHLMLREASHKDANPEYIREDMELYSDFELHELCCKFKSLSKFRLTNSLILDSGKFKLLDSLLPPLKESKSKVLLFSQFCMTLDIIEVYMQIRDHKYMRLDGGTKVDDRLDLIDEFNSKDSDVFVFLLTTRAGGVGINLTAATTAIIHDLDFNPYNDKQAEDRCHRMGQEKEVTIHKLVTEDSIEEGIYSIAEKKLQLGNDMCVAGKAASAADGGGTKSDMKSLLRGVLNL